MEFGDVIDSLFNILDCHFFNLDITDINIRLIYQIGRHVVEVSTMLIKVKIIAVFALWFFEIILDFFNWRKKTSTPELIQVESSKNYNSKEGSSERIRKELTLWLPSQG